MRLIGLINFFYLFCRIPDEVYLDKLRDEHVDIINEVWPHKYPGSEEFIRCQILMTDGFGLFLKSTNELVSWVLTNEHYCPGSLQTLDEHKRKGYGTVLTKVLSKHLAKEYKVDILSGIVKGNTTSERLFTGIGFKPIFDVSWCYIKKTVS